MLYCLTFPNDWVYMKCLVYGTYILEFIQSTLFIENSFQMFVTSFGDLEVINTVAEYSNPHCNRLSLLCKEWAADVLTSPQETTIIQEFYMHWISVLSQSKKGVLGAIIVISGQTVVVHPRSQEYFK